MLLLLIPPLLLGDPKPFDLGDPMLTPLIDDPLVFGDLFGRGDGEAGKLAIGDPFGVNDGEPLDIGVGDPLEPTILGKDGGDTFPFNIEIGDGLPFIDAPKLLLGVCAATTGGRLGLLILAILGEVGGLAPSRE
jgi:hypothetical protein